jgi:hypothetical protein
MLDICNYTLFRHEQMLLAYFEYIFARILLLIDAQPQQALSLLFGSLLTFT